MQIEFLEIVDKFSKIPLREVVAGDRPVVAEGGQRSPAAAVEDG